MGDGEGGFRVRGAYLEACNCEAICPCRRIGDVPGGRSTYGTCFGLLVWRIDDGVVHGVDVSGNAVALVFSYDDDEPGSPWSLVLHVDARASEEQHAELAELFLNGMSGRHTSQLPWIRKARHVVEVRRSAIELVEGTARVGRRISLRARRPVPTELRVSCIVPGYDRGGVELYADELAVDDAPFAFTLEGRCAFASDFDYSG
jgi:hypothetical protein